MVEHVINMVTIEKARDIFKNKKLYENDIDIENITDHEKDMLNSYKPGDRFFIPMEIKNSKMEYILLVIGSNDNTTYDSLNESMIGLKEIMDDLFDEEMFSDLEGVCVNTQDIIHLFDFDVEAIKEYFRIYFKVYYSYFRFIIWYILDQKIYSML